MSLLSCSHGRYGDCFVCSAEETASAVNRPAGIQESQLRLQREVMEQHNRRLEQETQLLRKAEQERADMERRRLELQARGIWEAHIMRQAESQGQDPHEALRQANVREARQLAAATEREAFAGDELHQDQKNARAGAWGVAAYAVGNANAQRFVPGVFTVVRAAKLTADATPEPVKKGRTLTVKGRLTRANWETGTYMGNTNQTVKLQFRKKGASAYTTVKTVKAGTDGALKATVTATADGYWRWSFAGTVTTGPATSGADHVDVR